ncbi:cytochrome b [Rhizobium sp. BK176]|uniref:cytochrome b n=1 Tax=Rhizobium sp. BK176 TaxID=2587071 RepID=UPI0021696C9D|nr:cytochrome b [Rhizobium sp. BK176]MCS4090111.1 cytochrome b561 [Rhizobium sp. BK176]
MKFKNTETGYGLVAMAFHWTSAALAVGMFASGLWMTSLSYASSWYHTAPEYHKAVGVMFAALVLGRLAWKGINASPEEIGKPWEATAAKAVHGVLYLLLATLFVSGYLIATGGGSAVHLFGLVEVPSVVRIGKYTSLAGIVHLWSAYTLAAMTALHAGAALKHHFLDRDRVLVRMLGR